MTYHESNGVQIPDILPPVQQSTEAQVGKYAAIREAYMKEHEPIRYTNLLTTCTMWQYLETIQGFCLELVMDIQKDLANAAGVNEELKARDSFEWARKMTFMHQQAERMVTEQILCRPEHSIPTPKEQMENRKKTLKAAKAAKFKSKK